MNIARQQKKIIKKALLRGLKDLRRKEDDRKYKTYVNILNSGFIVEIESTRKAVVNILINLVKENL